MSASSGTLAQCASRTSRWCRRTIRTEAAGSGRRSRGAGVLTGPPCGRDPPAGRIVPRPRRGGNAAAGAGGRGGGVLSCARADCRGQGRRPRTRPLPAPPPPVVSPEIVRPMSWLKRERTGIKSPSRPARPEMPEGLWTKCDGCGEALFQTVLEENLWTCPHCGHHFRVPARTYVGYLVD